MNSEDIRLTEKMNPSVGQKPFGIKQTAFADSIFATVPESANAHQQ